MRSRALLFLLLAARSLDSNRMDAPGRNVSSPWPARIDIGDVTNDGNRSVIDGDIVEVTSETDANGHRIPVRVVVENGRIIEVEIAPATAVIDAYYDAVNGRRDESIPLPDRDTSRFRSRSRRRRRAERRNAFAERTCCAAPSSTARRTNNAGGASHPRKSHAT
jgi:hypothetical protein